MKSQPLSHFLQDILENGKDCLKTDFVFTQKYGSGVALKHFKKFFTENLGLKTKVLDPKDQLYLGFEIESFDALFLNVHLQDLKLFKTKIFKKDSEKLFAFSSDVFSLKSFLKDDFVQVSLDFQFWKAQELIYPVSKIFGLNFSEKKKKFFSNFCVEKKVSNFDDFLSLAFHLELVSQKVLFKDNLAKNQLKEIILTSNLFNLFNLFLASDFKGFFSAWFEIKNLHPKEFWIGFFSSRSFKQILNFYSKKEVKKQLEKNTILKLQKFFQNLYDLDFKLKSGLSLGLLEKAFISYF